MDQPQRTCPACGSTDYAFRSRNKLAAQPEQGEGEAVETKYHCQGCGHEWKVRAPAQVSRKPEQI